LLIASATQAASDKEFSYSWVETGYAKLDVRGNIDERLDGAYLRGSWDLGENFYLLGSYSKVDKSFSESYQTTISGFDVNIRNKTKYAVSQTEIGFGGYYALTSNADFLGDLSVIRLDGKANLRSTLTDPASGQSFYAKDSAKDHIYAAKLMAGVRGRPFSMLELWGKAGYIRMNEESWLLRRSSAVGNVGAQLRITPNIGLVGEAELYKDVRFYRVGLRASF